MDPINYSIDVQTPFQSALAGYQGGAAIRNDQQQQQQQKLALAQQQQQQQLLAGLAQKQRNGTATADDYSAVMTQIPSLAEPLTKAWATKNAAQQQSHASDLLQWGAAIKSGNADIAADQMEQRATAMEQANGSQSVPTQQSQYLRTEAQIIREHPEFALGQIQAMLAANPNGKDAAESLSKFGGEARAQELQPGLVAKGVADASKAGTEAKYAEPTAIIDLQKKGWDIKAVQEDINYKKEQNRINALNAAQARETNVLRREELEQKIKEAKSNLDQQIRTRTADAEGAAGTIDSTLNTIERIKKNPSLNDVLGTINGRLPGTNNEQSDAVALIETLASQAFLSQVPSMKGQGSLSDAEGKKLSNALTNLSRVQSSDQFKDNLDEAARLLKKARVNISTRSGLPLPKIDTPAAPGERPPLDSFNKPTGGASGDW